MCFSCVFCFFTCFLVCNVYRFLVLLFRFCPVLWFVVSIEFSWCVSFLFYFCLMCLLTCPVVSFLSCSMVCRFHWVFLVCFVFVLFLLDVYIDLFCFLFFFAALFYSFSIILSNYVWFLSCFLFVLSINVFCSCSLVCRVYWQFLCD